MTILVQLWCLGRFFPGLLLSPHGGGSRDCPPGHGREDLHRPDPEQHHGPARGHQGGHPQPR